MKRKITKVGRLAVIMTAETKQIESALDRVKSKLDAVTKSAEKAKAALSGIGQ